MAYAKDWALHPLVLDEGHRPLPPSSEMIGLYIADFAALTGNTLPCGC
ncbi:hypothetical protein P775_06500 [Puniceibacterium antarcticum]|uniref:Uncharacterized protein n=1 Tax=Puniceibacterium antarcticum TaxID=1206336 RepID=A0A2G8RHF5_9RHOB|nr:hypothetical protein P775_06500 [Puniceibacterium antarcticum]